VRGFFWGSSNAVLDFAIMHFFFKITKQATAEKRVWISAKRAELDDQE
jgi:hypothetical protein